MSNAQKKAEEEGDGLHLVPIAQPDEAAESPAARHLALILDARRKVSKSRTKWEYHKALAKEAKADFEAAIETLLSAVDDDEPNTPLLNGNASGGDVNATAWREVSVEQLGLPAGIVQKLKDADMTTIGHLADHGATGKGWTEIGGIGEASGDKIDAAMDKWWAEHPLPEEEESERGD